MKPLISVFGQRVRRLRKSKGMTQEQLGQKAGIDYKHIGGIERGVKVPSFEAIEKVAKALRVDYYELFLPDAAARPKAARKLDVLIRDIDKHGTPAMKEFLRDVLAAAQVLGGTDHA